ncbi:MAG: hypothetical protein QOG83_2472, partial [Alphaproteobacteria bacterium]|nr:hypothetical protein [Alphaproteobacteria bacterium]
MTPLSVPLETSAKARAAVSIAMLAALHGAALWFMLWSERDLVPSAAFALAWGVLNAFWLMVLRRPSPAAAASLVMIVILTLLSRFKHHTLLMTVTFTDVMIIDTDTFSFLMNVFPALGWQVAIAAALTVPALALVWLFDRLRVRRRVALGAFALCFALLAGLSFAVPLDREDEFLDHNYLSKFARSGAIAAVDLATRGVLESDAAVAERLSPAAATECQVPGKAPHIVLILDEASYDASVIPGAKVAADYQRHFRSFDGKARRLIVEGAGGPTWYTEYNVLSGLSVRSYGRFAGAVTRLATGRVQRGLPQALRHCGYRTLSVYPSMGGFLGARSYQASAGIDGFFDAKDLGTLARQPDAFHYAFAERLIAAQRGKSPLFVLVYLTANHWPWGYRFRPDLTPDWAETGNVLDIDEYLRRQSMSVRDYGQFVARLARDFPDDGFLLVR